MNKAIMKIFKYVKILTLVILMHILISCNTSQLSSPLYETITYDGEIITWMPISNATGYIIIINGIESNIYDNKVAYKANNDTFTFHITAFSYDDKYENSNTISKTFQPFETINEVNIDSNGKVTWKEIPNTVNYIVSIDNESNIKTYNTNSCNIYDFENLQAGVHTIKIRAVPIYEKYYSVFGDSKTFSILETLNENDISFNGDIITWKEVNGAKSYNLYINDELYKENITDHKFIYTNVKDTFKVSIRANGDALNIINSNISATKSFVYLDKISNVYVEDGILKWDKVEGADCYKLRLNGNEINKLFTECFFDNLSVNVLTNVEILPISYDSTYFTNWSDVFKVTILPSPILKWNEDYDLNGESISNVFWDGISNATGYVIKITYPDGNIEFKEYGNTQRRFNHDFLETGVYKIEIKAKANSIGTDVYDSLYSLPIEIERLSAPSPKDNNFILSNIYKSSEGFTVNFDYVNNAKSYKLYQDNKMIDETTNNYFKVDNPADLMSLNEQNYNYKIQSIGSVKTENGITYVKLNSLLSQSLSFKITILAVPQTPIMSGYIYSFNDINNNNGYIINNDDTYYESSDNSYDFSELEAGFYDLKVCAKGNGSNILSSFYSVNTHIFRLSPPRNVRIGTTNAAEGLLTFDSVKYAKSYYAILNNDGTIIPVNNMDYFNNYISENGTTLHMQAVANYYSDDGNEYYMTSLPGSTSTFIKFAKPTFDEIAFSNSELIWNAPNNINTDVYSPSYVIYSSDNSIYDNEQNGNSMDLESLKGGEYYSFRVKAIGDGINYVNSDLSDVVSIYKLSNPELSIENNSIVWKEVTNANSYAIFINGELIGKISHNESGYYKYIPDFKDPRKYNIEICAIGDGDIKYLNSEKSSIEIDAKQLETPEIFVSNNNGVIAIKIVTESQFSKGYAYTINGETFYSTETEYNYQTTQSGVYVIRVYALGGTLNENRIYYVDSQSIGGKNYTITIN